MRVWGAVYWPVWLVTAVVTFLVPEIYALASGHPENTLSDWVWRTLKIARHQNPGAWTAADFLTFGCWVVLVVWLTAHFWFRRFA